MHPGGAVRTKKSPGGEILFRGTGKQIDNLEKSYSGSG